jgi:hypothetical protein
MTLYMCYLVVCVISFSHCSSFNLVTKVEAIFSEVYHLKEKNATQFNVLRRKERMR